MSLLGLLLSTTSVFLTLLLPIPVAAQLQDAIPLTNLELYGSVSPCLQTLIPGIINQQLSISKCSALNPQVGSAICLCANPSSSAAGSSGLLEAIGTAVLQDCPGTNRFMDPFTQETASTVIRVYCATNVAARALASLVSSTGDGSGVTAGATTSAGTPTSSTGVLSPGATSSTVAATSVPSSTGSSSSSSGADTGMTTDQKIALGVGIAVPIASLIATIITIGYMEKERRERNREHALGRRVHGNAIIDGYSRIVNPLVGHHAQPVPQMQGPNTMSGRWA